MVKGLKETWKRLLPGSKTQKIQAALAEKYSHFQRLLAANNQVLEVMADMEEKLSGDYLFDFQYIRASVKQLTDESAALVEALNSLGANRYQNLTRVYRRLVGEVEETLHRTRKIPTAPLVIPFESLNAEMFEIVGGKSANLGEVKNRVKLPVARGFAISSYAYKLFLQHNQLGEWITDLLGSWRLDDLDSLAQVSKELKKEIYGARVPPELEAAMEEAYEHLAAQEGERPLLAMRSSSVGEDLTFTFAGQYATYLNVRPEEMSARYKDIVASLFTPRALFYYKNKGFREEEMAMGVAVMPMVQAKASGVLFTRNPEAADQEGALINAVWGLGKYAVSGWVELDHYLVAYQPRGHILKQSIPPKKVMLVNLPQGGVQEEPVPAALINAPCLEKAQIDELMEWAAILEAYYQKPQDVEWALDERGQLWLLQCRPLQVVGKKTEEPQGPRTLKQYPVLLDRGTVASPGVGAGQVVLVHTDEDLKNFPPGGVLVAKRTSPKYVTVMPYASAIITDAGSPTGHMALLAREFQIPAIVNTGKATEVLTPGMEVTVDANYNNIYEGIVPELLETQKLKKNDLAGTPIFQTLKAIVRKVVPLHLINPQDESFAPENCRTLHDVVRYAHEFSMREMFKITEKELSEGEVVDLDSGLPFKVAILDLGGGLKRWFRRRVKPRQIQSIPFKAFWDGVSAMRWPQGKPAGVQSLSSIFVKSDAAIAEGADPYRDQSYLVLTQNYMNFSIRLGYHLSTVEAYVSDQINDNYINFFFRGGGSTPERRERRARLIETIIDHLDLTHNRKGDLIEARLAKYSVDQMNRSLFLLGKLTAYTKQLDMVLFSEGIVDWYIKDFLQEHVRVKK